MQKINMECPHISTAFNLENAVDTSEVSRHVYESLRVVPFVDSCNRNDVDIIYVSVVKQVEGRNEEFRRGGVLVTLVPIVCFVNEKERTLFAN